MIGVSHGVAGFGPAPPGRHLDGVDDELGTDVIGDRPAHDPTAERVEDHGEVDLAGPGRVFGDVHDPEPVWLGRVEGPAHQIGRRLDVGVASGATGPSAPVDASDAGLAHQALDPFAAASGIETQAELGVDPG